MDVRIVQSSKVEPPTMFGLFEFPASLYLSLKIRTNLMRNPAPSSLNARSLDVLGRKWLALKLDLRKASTN